MKVHVVPAVEVTALSAQRGFGTKLRFVAGRQEAWLSVAWISWSRCRPSTSNAQTLTEATALAAVLRPRAGGVTQ